MDVQNTRILTYEYQHIVKFEETNLVGNVYYTNYVSWQGQCREMFLYDRAPEILEELSKDLALATVRVSCEYFAELFAFDKVIIRMSLGALKQNRITMFFEYWCLARNPKEPIARGEQEVACMRREADKLVPTPIPGLLRDALQPYALA
jgi:enediyne core biosynthesis thioesterase